MSYTINPNAKNKWARNAENTMDLSLETDASSVYLDNGRTLEQELGEGSMVSNVTTVDSSMSKVIDGTLDGAYESCVFKGKSLVNLMTSCKDETLIEYCNPPANSNVANVSMIKPNTVYTIIYSVKYREEGDTGHLVVRTQQDGGDINVSSGFTFGTTYKRFAYKFTTPSTINYFVLRSNGHYFHVKEVMLLEGDYTNVDLPYFTGLCDVKMPILRNVSNEAFCHDSLEGGSISGNNGGNISSTNSRARTKDMKKLNGATSILFSDNLLGVEKYVFSYDSNKRYLGRTPTNWETGNEIKPVEGAYYYRVVFTKYLEELPRSMYIIPKNHKTNILHTPETVILRSLPNGVRDELNLKTGEYIKRIGEVVLDGSDDEGWSQHTGGSNIYYATFKITDCAGTGITGTSRSVKCDRLTNTVSDDSTVSSGLNKYCICPLSNTLTGLSFSLTHKETLEEAKIWLQQNPITVQYQLVTPITTTIEPLTIPFAYQNGHVILESGYEGQSLLPTLEYSTVVNKTGLIENVAKTIQRQEKQLTMLEKMLIQNIINLDYNNTLLTLKNEMEEML